MSKFIIAIVMLVFSNLFMSYAWYGHLKHLKTSPWFIAALISWGIAFFEYLIQVPANRIGSSFASIQQLKITQEAISLLVFIPFSIYILGEKPKLNYIYATICILFAVHFIFKSK